MRKIHTVEQGTPEWFALRSLRLTASKADTIATAGKGLETLCLELVADHLSGAEKEHFSNHHTERGTELEPQAREVYELLTGNTVEQVGFVTLGDYAGASPDGLVGEDGLLEIKCRSDDVYLRERIDGKVPSSALWQMQMQVLVTGRDWCDYFCYNPNFEKSFILIRVQKDEGMQDKLKAGLKKGEELITSLMDKYHAT